MQKSGLIDPEQAANLIQARDPGLFSQRLLDIARNIAGVDELFAYRACEGAYRTLASSSDLPDVAERAAAYAKRFHHSDPAVSARLATPVGAGFICRIRADSIELAAYRKLCFEQPRFSEKICFGWRFPDHDLVLTFYHRLPDSDVDMVQLGALAQLALTGLVQILQAETAQPPIARIETRLANANTRLTGRELQVCARTLTGMTADQIANELQLSPPTVLTYRQRAYQKMGISRANQMVASVLD
ncbi:helix-turn-helix transcriptional regulator [Paracoccus sp. Z330]|uniref:Helix-turn-helix transcriptional regulator n=1 Tax=Paracoccus onchidii TaxID=3017813 RepID=A0ABT4ZFS1_9RHOB|nr:helix-turn-helix transcriptional regulator [Paracoccus onchidii]MDB6178226.1 helix-turn-helix transcriptional regulator [Paracoccus onchidii]